MQPTPQLFPTKESIPENARIDASRFARQYLAGGEVRQSRAGAEVSSPVCLRKPDGTLERMSLGQAPQLDAEEAVAALRHAKEAWAEGRGAWPTMRVARRIGAVESFAQAMPAVREDVVRLLMWEIGKTRKDAETEFDRTVQYIHDTVEALKNLDRDCGRFQMEQGFIGQIRRAPLGVVLCMGPFNYPLNETYTTLIPALAMGNVIVSKLPRYGALLHLPLLDAMQKCFPPGVVNIIQGDGPVTISPIIQSGDVDVLAFIGTSRVANIIAKQHPKPNRMRRITGLEAKNPAVVLPDADLDVAVKECVAGALTFNGQRCTALKLLFVHASIADRFVDRLCTAVDNLKLGMPWEPGVHITPLPEQDKTTSLQRFVDDATGQGAKVVNQGGKAAGTLYSPAVVFPVTPAMSLYRDEQFGPIVPVSIYKDEREIDEFMRHSPYGQQVSIFGRDPERLAFLVDALANQVCRINLNTQCRRGPDTFPFTGRKDSAEGTLSVSDALRAFSIRTVVSIASSDSDKQLVTDIVTRRLSTFLTTDFIF
jgi:glyceraldehyde-3-phosphate dehydrogenase (NADP+)